MDKCFCSGPQTLAMATVPKQEWCNPYPLETALYEGTIFPCMNLLFHKAPLSSEADRTCSKPINNEEREREDMMKEIYAISFALNDLTLYLDTHPDCPDGTPIYYDLLKRRLNLLADFASKFYPLTQISMVTGNCDSSCFGWSEGPMPWEGGCI